jgi:methylated-DNA-[protein]-cysteine S-methyltransferase
MSGVTSVVTPIGELWVHVAHDHVVGIGWTPPDERPPEGLEAGDGCRTSELLRATVTQLEEYFAGERRRFDLPLRNEGTPFQTAAWQALRGIPYGTTVSYAEQARRLGRHGAARAVGGANGRNPLPVIVPCHRVIAADGRLGGYSGGSQQFAGIEAKRWLIEHERAVLARQR